MLTAIRQALASAVSDTAADAMDRDAVGVEVLLVERGRTGGRRGRRAQAAAAAGSSLPISFVLPASQPAPRPRRQRRGRQAVASPRARPRSRRRARRVGAAGARAVDARRERRARPAGPEVSCVSRAPCRRGPRAQAARMPVTVRSSREQTGPGPAIVVVQQRQRALEVAARRAPRSPRPAARSPPSGWTRSRRRPAPAPRRRAACWGARRRRPPWRARRSRRGGGASE